MTTTSRPAAAGTTGRAERAPLDRWRRYVALGDSFTEGLWDHHEGPDEAPAGARGEERTLGDERALRGWSDRLAEVLAARRAERGQTPLEYANLAIRGRLLPTILTEQLPVALALEPDLVSVVGGGNDVLRPAVDVDAISARLEAAVVELRSRGIDVLLSTGVDTADSPLIRATRGRTAVLNSHVWSIARRHGAYVLDVWGMRSLRDWRMWDADRIHLTPEGHARVTQAALVALGLEPDDPAWDDPLVPLPHPRAVDRLRGDLTWVREHVVPWATRRFRRTSSGLDRVPKQAVYRVVAGPGGAATGGPGDTRSTGERTEPLDSGAAAREDGGRTAGSPTPQHGADGRHGTAHDGVPAPGTQERTSAEMDRIDFTTSDDPSLPGDVAGIRSTRHHGDVLEGGNPDAAPDHLVEEWEGKAGLVGASPDGDPESIEAYESGQDDGQMV